MHFSTAEHTSFPFCAVLILFILLGLCPKNANAQELAPAINLSIEEQDWLKAHPVIRVQNEKNWAPFNFYDHGQPQGLSIDYMGILSEILGIEVEYLSGPTWNEFLGMVKKNHLDVILNIVETNERKEYLLFTDQYIKNPKVIISKDSNNFSSLDQLIGKKVAVPKGFFYDEFISKEYPDIERLSLPDTLSCLKAVAYGEADATLGSAAVLRYLIANNFLAGLHVSGEATFGDPNRTHLRIGVRKDWPILRSILNKAIASVPPSQIIKLQQKWGKDASAASAPPAAAHDDAMQNKSAVPQQKSISFQGIITYVSFACIGLALLIFILTKTIGADKLTASFGSLRFRVFVLLGLILFVGVVVFSSWLALNDIREHIISDVEANLRIRVKAADDSLDLWVGERRSLMKNIGHNPELVAITKRMLNEAPDVQTLLSSSSLQDARLFFENDSAIFPNIGFFIISPDEISIGSRRDTNIGTRNLIALHRPDIIKRAFAGEILFVPPIQSDVHLDTSDTSTKNKLPPTMFFIGPIQDQDGRILAVMTLRVDPTKGISDIMNLGRDTADSFEAYIFNREGTLLSASRFEEQLRGIGLIEEDQSSAMNIEIRDPGINLMENKGTFAGPEMLPLTTMASGAITLRELTKKDHNDHAHLTIENNMTGYRDYRGVPVFGAWLWNTDLDLGIVAEMDIKDALSSYDFIRTTVYWVLGFTLSLSIGAVLLVLSFGERTRKVLNKARNELEDKVLERTKRLKESEEQSLLILSSIGEGLFGVDTDGTATFINPAAATMLGYAPEEILGKSVHALIHHSHADGSKYNDRKCPMNMAFTDGSPHTVDDEVLWRKDGTSFPVEYTATPVIHESTVEGAVIVFRDATERKASDALKVDRDVAMDAAHRTEEAQAKLSEKMIEIERFNRLSMGREQRIIELKKQLNELATDHDIPLLFNSMEEEIRLPEAPREELDSLETDLPLSELIDVQRIQSLLENFCNAVGVASAIIDLKGNILAAARWQRACTDFHRSCEASCARCIESDTELSLKLQEGKDFTLYRCKNGMNDAASPIILNGNHLANVFIGQFHVAAPDMEFFRQQAVEFGYDEEDYLAAVEEAPIVEEDSLPEILGFLSGFAKLLASLSLERRRAVAAEENMTHRAEELHQGRMGALSLAEDAEEARNEITHYRDHLEELIQERTNELRIIEERTRNILESLGEGLFGVDMNGIATFINPAATKMLGYKSEEIVGQSIHEVIHHHHADGSFYDVHDCPMYKSFTNGTPDTIIDEVLWHKDGTSIPVEYTATPLIQDNVVEGAVIVFRDITERKKAERALSESKQQIQSLIDNIPGVVYRCLPQFPWTMLILSEGVEVLTGYPVKDYLGDNPVRQFGEHIHPDDLESSAAPILEAIVSGEPYVSEYRIIDAHGEVHSVYAKGKAYYGSDGKPKYLDGSIFDISDLKKTEELLKEERRRLQAILDASPIGVGISTDSVMRYVNPRLEKLASIKVGDHASKAYVGQNSRSEVMALMNKDGMVSDFSMQMLGSDGKTNHILATFLPTKFKGEESFLAWAADVTPLKQTELKLAEAKEKAEEATKAKSDFLANMSHEIRTPMNAIIGMSHLTLKTELTSKQLDYISKIDGSAKALLGIINDILDFSKIEAGKLEIEAVEFHLDEALDNLSSLISVKTQEKGLELIFDVDPELPHGLIGDPLRLGQILVNLCGNAVKFTDEGEVVVSAKLLEQGPDGVRVKFSVRDTGIGLSETQRSKLFQSFSQADTSTTRKYGGTGLGLTISKKLSELMGGEIGVDSVPGEGSTFWFTINFGVHDKNKKPQRDYKAIAADLKDKRMLIVDDNETALQILQASVEGFGFDVSTAPSAYQALNMLESALEGEQFPLVLMDWKMPGMNGIEATRRIKENPKLKDVTTVIMVTAYGREEVMNQAANVGIEGFLVKPVNQSVLFNTIMEAFGKDTGGDQVSHTVKEFNSETLAPVRGAHILLAEDNEINQQVAKEILEGAGFFVDIANDGLEALEMVQKKNYDAVLMDIQMPEMDGKEATIAIRKLEQYKDMPIIAMTAHAMAGDREKSIEAGMQDHITKPIDPDDLFTALAQWISPGERELPEGFEATKPQATGASRKNDDLPETLPGFNMEEGLKRLGGNTKLYKDLLIKLRENYATAADEIQSLTEKGQSEEAERLAHSVKGVAGNLGAGSLQNAAKALELKLKDGGTDSEAELAAFASEIDAMQISLAAIQKDEPQTGPTSGEVSPHEDLIASMEELIPHLQKRKPKPSKAALETINALGWPDALALDVKDMGKLINRYKFKDALPKAESILDKLKG